ncbi:MAG: hypothetical protein HZA89_12985 [Verrucomicrobia bacterium]|nr:hypothetical protein [Verrucomicrobiota bacterium]
MRTIITISISTFCLLLITACQSLREIASTPPARAIVISTTFDLKAAMGTSMTFPAGKYLAAKEDSLGFYFTAPSKIQWQYAGRNYNCEGGFFWPKQSTRPTRFYVLHPVMGIDFFRKSEMEDFLPRMEIEH